MDETIECPSCKCKQSKVLETREARVRGRYFIMRRRQCRYCKFVWKTKEINETSIPFPSGTSRKKPDPDLDVGPEDIDPLVPFDF